MKYVIDVPDFDKYNMPSSTKGRVVAIPITIDDTTFNIPTEMAFIEPYTGPDRQAIEDEVWDLARKLERMKCYEVHEAFGIEEDNSAWLCNQLTYQEAKDRYEEWVKAKSDKESPIKVDDEVMVVSSPYYGEKGVCISADPFVVLQEDGTVFRTVSLVEWAKTGRTFPQVTELLKAMKGE